MKETVLPENLSGVHIHFVGIKGTGMAALAEIAAARGAVITGSDVSEHFYTDEILERLGVHSLPFSAENVTPQTQLVVRSSAYSPEENPDLAEAGRLGIPSMLYSEALGALSRTAYSAGICGVHGKTTTAGLVGAVLKETDLPAQVLAGSVMPAFGNSCVMTSEQFPAARGRRYFAAETCEYQRHFMAFSPKKIILTSVESDHQDYYPLFSDIQNAFIDYICLLPEGGSLIFCADDPGAAQTARLAAGRRPDIVLIPYGEAADGAYKVSFGGAESGCQRFSLAEAGGCVLLVPGRHNVLNAAAAFALGCELLKEDGRNPADYYGRLKQGLASFSGGKRRSEIVARKKNRFGNDIIFIDDYGHHPTAIRTTLAGYREFYRGCKIIVDFMSHTYTRTAALLEEFAHSFSDADMVVINRIYASARETASASAVTGEVLARRTQECHRNAVYAGEFSGAADIIAAELSKDAGPQFPGGYVFVTMGAGDNWKAGQLVLERLSSGENREDKK